MGDGEVVYTTRSETYATAFAMRNHLSFEHRRLVVRTA